MFRVDADFGRVFVFVFGSRFGNAGGNVLVISYGDLDMFPAQNARQDHRRDAHGADDQPLTITFFQSAADFLIDVALGAFDGKVAEVQSRAETARKNDSLKILRTEFRQIFDVSAANTRRLRQNIAIVFISGNCRGMSGKMVDRARLPGVGRKTLIFAAGTLNRQHGQYRFVNFRTVKNAAAGQYYCKAWSFHFHKLIPFIFKIISYKYDYITAIIMNWNGIYKNMQSKISTLKNGLRVITSDNPQLETVSLGIWVKTGSAYEKPEVNGISHFLEHMSFKGTQRRSALEISEAIEDVGGQSNAYTSREFTAYYAKMLKNDAELALDVLADSLMNSTFPEDELQKEREVVVQEIKQTIDTPDDIVFDYFQESAFGSQAIGRSILGPKEIVRGFTRETLQDYLKTNYAAENMVVCAVGNIDHDRFVKMTEERMSTVQPKTNFTPEPQEYKGGFYLEKRDIEQAHVLLGFNGVPYSTEQYYPIILFSTLFGGGMSSRLFQEIREKRGLVYSVYSFTGSHTGAGIFGIYAGTGAKDLPTLMPVVLDEIKKVCNEKVLQKELDRAKTQLKASMLMSLESSSSVAEILARQHLIYNRIIPIPEMIERIDKVTLDDIRQIAQTVFSSKPTYTLLGAIDKHMDYDELQECLKK